MATFTATAATAQAPAKYFEKGPVVRVVDYSFSAAAASAGDVIQMVKVPKGAIVTNVGVAMIQTGTVHSGAVTVNVGDGNDASAYAAAVVLSGSAVALTAIPARGIGRTYSADDTIDITVAAVSAAGASGGVRLVVQYQNDGA